MAVPRDWGDLPQEEPPRWAAPGRRWERAPLFAGSARIDACGWEVWHLTDLYREDDSAIRTRSGPRGMAALRNLAIGALHQAGRHDTTEATRWASRNMDRPFTILGLTS